MRFSTACCAWKATTSSGTLASPTSRSSAASSPAAFAARTRARSCPSRLGKKLALYQRVVQHRASHSTPVFSLRLAYHDDVSRELKLAG